MTTNEKLRNTTIRHAHFIEQYKNDEVQKIIAMLNKTDASLRTQLLKYKGKTPTITSKRLALMRKDIQDIVEDSKLILKNKLEWTAVQFGNMESKWLGDIIKDAVPGEVPISFIQPSPTQILAAIKARPFNNETLQGMINGWALTKKNTLINAVQQAFVQGQSIDDAVKTLFGTKALQYTDALIDGSRRQIRTQVRTALNHFSSVSREITYKANADLIKGVQWVSTLDGRTTLQCINLDGKIDYDDGSVRELNGLRPPAHYNCYHKDTEVYTDKGWKLFSKLDGTERCLSFNPDNESEQKFIKPINYIKYRHKGQLISIKSHDFSMSVTPDHNMLLKYRGEGASNKYRFVQAKDMPKWNNRIYRGVSWTGNNATTARLGDYEIGAQLYCKFMGYYLSEGSTTKASKNCYYSGISQFKHVDKMYEELKELPFNVTKVSEGINIYDASVGEDLRKYGHSYEKYVPQVIKDMSKENIEVFLNASILGDGSKLDADAFGYKVEGFKIIFTSSSRMAEDIGELIMKVGGRPSYTLLKRKGKECTFKNGTYTTNHDIWQINWCKNLYSQTENLKKEYFDYDDFVYCVELPEWHSLFIRYEGKVAWSGNCRSTTVPVIKSLKELGLSDKEFRPSTRASMNGQVPETMRYKDWFAKQDEKFQRQVLGAKKYDLWKSGQFTFDKFVDNGTTLNLNQLSMIQDIPEIPSIASIDHGTSGMDAFGQRLTLTGKSVGGSTGAKVYIDDEGQEWILKNYSGNKAQVRNEYIANRLYEKMGISVPESRLAMVDNELTFASKRLPSGYTTIGMADLEKAAKAQSVKKGFVTDAWLANWDVAGQSIDNLIWDGKNISSITRIDQGGTLFYRAQGGKKGSAFSPIVNELKSLRDSNINYASAKLFSEVTDKNIAAQINTLKLRLKDIDLYDIISSSGVSPELAKEYKNILEERLQYLYTWEKDYKKSLKPPKVSKNLKVPLATDRSSAEKVLDKTWEKLTKFEKDMVSDFSGSKYTRINRDALQGIRNNKLDNALDKLPRYEGIVGRGMSNIRDIEMQFEKWKSGEWAGVEWKAYSSSTVTAGREFSSKGGYLAIVNSKGKNSAGFIGSKSLHPSEHEYLFSAGAKFKVVGYAEKDYGGDIRRILLLDEVDNIPLSQKAPQKFDYSDVYYGWQTNTLKF